MDENLQPKQTGGFDSRIKTATQFNKLLALCLNILYI